MRWRREIVGVVISMFWLNKIKEKYFMEISNLHNYSSKSSKSGERVRSSPLQVGDADKMKRAYLQPSHCDSFSKPYLDNICCKLR